MIELDLQTIPQAFPKSLRYPWDSGESPYEAFSRQKMIGELSIIYLLYCAEIENGVFMRIEIRKLQEADIGITRAGEKTGKTAVSADILLVDRYSVPRSRWWRCLPWRDWPGICTDRKESYVL